MRLNNKGASTIAIIVVVAVVAIVVAAGVLLYYNNNNNENSRSTVEVATADELYSALEKTNAEIIVTDPIDLTVDIELNNGNNLTVNSGVELNLFTSTLTVESGSALKVYKADIDGTVIAEKGATVNLYNYILIGDKDSSMKITGDGSIKVVFGYAWEITIDADTTIMKGFGASDFKLDSYGDELTIEDCTVKADCDVYINGTLDVIEGGEFVNGEGTIFCNISGNITDDSTGVPVEGATVIYRIYTEVFDETFTTTDSKGNYSLYAEYGTEGRLLVSQSGYLGINAFVTIDDAILKDFILTPTDRSKSAIETANDFNALYGGIFGVFETDMEISTSMDAITVASFENVTNFIEIGITSNPQAILTEYQKHLDTIRNEIKAAIGNYKEGEVVGNNGFTNLIGFWYTGTDKTSGESLGGGFYVGYTGYTLALFFIGMNNEVGVGDINEILTDMTTIIGRNDRTTTEVASGPALTAALGDDHLAIVITADITINADVLVRNDNTLTVSAGKTLNIGAGHIVEVYSGSFFRLEEGASLLPERGMLYYEVSGTVTEFETDDPIVGAVLNFIPVNSVAPEDIGDVLYTATTDANGCYTFFVMAGGAGKLIASADGYFSVSRNMTVNGPMEQVHFLLEHAERVPSNAKEVSESFDAAYKGLFGTFKTAAESTSTQAITMASGSLSLSVISTGLVEDPESEMANFRSEQDALEKSIQDEIESFGGVYKKGASIENNGFEDLAGFWYNATFDDGDPAPETTGVCILAYQNDLMILFFLSVDDTATAEDVNGIIKTMNEVAFVVISGKVTNASGGSAISGATVSFSCDSERGYYADYCVDTTDGNGSYSLTVDKGITGTINVIYNGFQSSVRDVIDAEESQVYDVQLSTSTSRYSAKDIADTFSAKYGDGLFGEFVVGSTSNDSSAKVYDLYNNNLAMINTGENGEEYINNYAALMPIYEENAKNSVNNYVRGNDIGDCGFTDTVGFWYTGTSGVEFVGGYCFCAYKDDVVVFFNGSITAGTAVTANDVIELLTTMSESI